MNDSCELDSNVISESNEQLLKRPASVTLIFAEISIALDDRLSENAHYPSRDSVDPESDEQEADHGRFLKSSGRSINCCPKKTRGILHRLQLRREKTTKRIGKQLDLRPKMKANTIQVQISRTRGSQTKASSKLRHFSEYKSSLPNKAQKASFRSQ
jgi:hypothetical protein